MDEAEPPTSLLKLNYVLFIFIFYIYVLNKTFPHLCICLMNACFHIFVCCFVVQIIEIA